MWEICKYEKKDCVVLNVNYLKKILEVLVYFLEIYFFGEVMFKVECLLYILYVFILLLKYYK